MFDVITFGSASHDIFLKSKNFLKVHGKEFSTGVGICFCLGSKIEVDNVYFASGGGGTNTAATFAKQGLSAAYFGVVGDDLAGSEIIEELKAIGINTDLVERTKEKATNHSVFLNCKDCGDRTILVYRGASDLMREDEIPWDKIKNAKWFYLAPFAGRAARLTEKFVDFARSNDIKVAFNPGYNQLTLPKSTLIKILNRTDVLILNKEEASALTGIPFKKESAIFKKIDQIMPGIAIMTKGEDGVVLSDGKCLYRAGIIKTKVVDATGAGDSFGSGFVSGLIEKNDIIYAIQLAMANSASCLAEWGAKAGLLSRDSQWQKVKVIKSLCN